MLICVSCRCKVFACTKTCFYAFLCRCKFLHLLKHVSMSLLWCRMVGWIPLHLVWEVNGGLDIGHGLRHPQLPWLAAVVQCDLWCSWCDIHDFLGLMGLGCSICCVYMLGWHERNYWFLCNLSWVSIFGWLSFYACYELGQLWIVHIYSVVCLCFYAFFVY
jgi:hypothetical protein